MMPLPKVDTEDWNSETSFYIQSTPAQRRARAKALGMEVYSYERRMRERGIKLSPSVADVFDHICVPDERGVAGHPGTPSTLYTGPKMKTAVSGADFHFPFQDDVAVELFIRFVTDAQPDYIIFPGDLHDFAQISRFDRNPARLPLLQEDINKAKAFLRRVRTLCPNTEIIFEEGNHENRLQKFLWKQAPEFASLDCLDLRELFELDEMEIRFIPYEEGLMVNDIFLILHGDIASVHSGYTAKRMYEKHGGCGMTNHCHRGGSFYKRDRFGTWGWWENFCLCTLDPEWMQNPNWTQGFSLVHFREKRFWVEQVPIVNHAFIYGGEVYE